jgi:hypothetical protein
MSLTKRANAFRHALDKDPFLKSVLISGAFGAPIGLAEGDRGLKLLGDMALGMAMTGGATYGGNAVAKKILTGKFNPTKAEIHKNFPRFMSSLTRTPKRRSELIEELVAKAMKNPEIVEGLGEQGIRDRVLQRIQGDYARSRAFLPALAVPNLLGLYGTQALTGHVKESSIHSEMAKELLKKSLPPMIGGTVLPMGVDFYSKIKYQSSPQFKRDVVYDLLAAVGDREGDGYISSAQKKVKRDINKNTVSPMSLAGLSALGTLGGLALSAEKGDWHLLKSLLSKTKMAPKEAPVFGGLLK